MSEKLDWVGSHPASEHPFTSARRISYYLVDSPTFGARKVGIGVRTSCLGLVEVNPLSDSPRCTAGGVGKPAG